MIIVKAIMEKVVLIQYQTGNFSRDMDKYNKSKMKTSEIKNRITEVKRAFNGLFSRCYPVKGRIR